MNKFIAFLRGINVGGKNMIKMVDLVKCFEAAGLENVKTYIQSGNVIFDSSMNDADLLKVKIERQIDLQFGKKIIVILRTKSEIENLIQRDPFKDHAWGTNTKLYICFMDRYLVVQPSMPIRNDKEALVLIDVIGADAILVSLPKDGEHFGFPNPFIEKELKVLSTARNWNTVMKVNDLLR